ncbi:MAG: hypothetical protein GY854_34735 [Deltaproteobacteria bacterium]|nr:hypothetical protein [Deltaproteobacteria bacterium]
MARVAFFSLYQKAITLEGIFDWVQFREALFTGAIVMSVVFILEEFRGARQEKKEVELKLVKTQNERMRSQLKALQSQINPHLLFNSLNTIASFIPTDPDAAEEMTVELANLLRAVLEASREAHHSLADELRLCRDYLQIEKRRFGERLTTNIQIADTVKTKEVTIPVLVLQPLVENAVKYAVAPRASGGQIEIAIRKQDQTIEISIEDDGPGPGQSTASPGAGTGIENTRKRLELEWNSAAGLEIDERKSGGTRAVVRLPWPQCRIDGTIESNVRA